MARRLKVYRAQLGFEDSIVAAPNQGEALAAWGVRQNLFAEGQAEVETDEDAVAEALKHPGAPLRRPVGGKGGLSRKAPIPEAPSAARKPKADRRELDAAEAALARLRKDHEAELEDLERRRKQLEDEAADTEKAWRRSLGTAERRIDKARRACERAGG